MTALDGRHRYRDLNAFLRERFGFRVQKIRIDAGFTCPNRDGTLSHDGCIYCDATGSGTGQWNKGFGIAQQVLEAAKTLSRKYKAQGFLAYFQAFTNTYASIERLRELYEEALSVEGVLGLCVGTRPDCLDGPVLDLLASYTDRWMIWLELGLQSAHDETLKVINRGHDFQTFVRAVKDSSGRGIWLCAHLILGLPGEGPQEVRETARRISTLPLHGLKLHSQHIVRGTRLEALFRERGYRPWSQDQYVDSVCDVLERIPHHWVIQRLTGDPQSDSLVAPQWSLDKQWTLQAIWRRLEARETWQGNLMGAPPPETWR
jgi:radical SAM protein (TIGR01212 family)